MKEESISTNKEINSEKSLNISISQIKQDLTFLKKDFLFFKDDILKEIKTLETKIDVQKKENEKLKDVISTQNSKMTNIHFIVESISNQVNSKEAMTNYYREKIDILMDFKKIMEDLYAKQEYKIKVNFEELNKAIDKYDKVIFDNLTYMGTIGKNSKFKDFHGLIEYILSQIKIFTFFKEKNEMEIKSFKNKLDTTVNSLNFQVSGIIGNVNEIVMSKIKDAEKKYSKEIKSIDEKIMKFKEDNLEQIKNSEKERNDMIKKMKQELVELFESSVKKLNESNNSIQKTLDNYEIQFSEIKKNINTINDVYNKMKYENENISIYNEDQHDFKINSTKSDFFKMSNYSIRNERNDNNPDTKRIQSAKSVLQNYIEGNSIYQELIENNKLRCKHHENSDSRTKKIMSKYYNEGITNIINVNGSKSLDNNMNKNYSTDIRRMSQTVNSNIMKQSSEENVLKDKEKNNKYRKETSNRKSILIKGGNENNSINKSLNKKKTKSKEADKIKIKEEKFGNIFDKNRISKLKLLGDLSFLCDDIDYKKLPKIDKNEDIILKIGKYLKINKNKFENVKFKEYNVFSKFKNHNNNHQKAQKTRQKFHSSENSKRHHRNNNENEKNNSLNDIIINNENIPEKIKKLIENSRRKKSCDELNKKSNTFRNKSEKGK